MTDAINLCFVHALLYNTPGPAFPASHVQHISNLHSKFALGHTMTLCRSKVDIQSETAEIRRGKKKEERQKKHDENIMSASATQGGHNK